MKATSTIWPLAIILAGGLIIRKQQQVKGCKGVGSIYDEEAEAFANKYGVRLQILDSDYKQHFADDKRPRMVYKCKLSRGRNSYTFDFGASYADPSEPSMYDVLAALTKYDVGSFDDFCAEFGYEPYEEDYYSGRIKQNKQAMKIYRAVQREYEAVERLFGDVMDELQEIN